MIGNHRFEERDLSSEQPSQGFHLADWQVRPALSELERDGMVVQLEPKVMAVLETLASKPGEVFSREELERQVWQGSVIGYDALAKAINKLREALGDDKKDPRYIQTLSKKGYRIIAEVSFDASPSAGRPETEKFETSGSDSHPAPTNRNWLILSGVVTALILVGVVFLLQKDDAGQQAPVIKPATLNDNKPTIVVLPFRNISPDDKDDYLADGLTSDLTTNLSKQSRLWVTASNATLAYKNTDITPEKIRQKFNARYVISGEVNKIAQAIRINVHLTDIENGNILWAERYDRQFADLFAIQDEVTEKILDRLSLTLTKEEKQRIAKRYTNNLEAYETFLRAQFLLNARTPEDNLDAREMYRKAIELDPGFSRAYAGMSYSYAIGHLRQWPADTDQPMKKALQLANKALELDKDLPESYWAAAFAHLYEQNIDKGHELLNHALMLNPNYADAYALLAANYLSRGMPEKLIEMMAKAYRLNPAGGYLYDLQLGRAYYFMGDYELALNYFTEGLARNPTFIDMQMYTAANYVRLGRFEEAGWMILEAKQFNPDFDPHTWVKTYPFLDNKGYREKLLKDLDLAEMHSKQ